MLTLRCYHSATAPLLRHLLVDYVCYIVTVSQSVPFQFCSQSSFHGPFATLQGGSARYTKKSPSGAQARSEASLMFRELQQPVVVNNTINSLPVTYAYYIIVKDTSTLLQLQHNINV